ncbi:LacI family DNA-binding transcriptional regulator [Anaeromicrobium sediminis]|uniref:Uncharacterized protein n=1 Tax=Anaeromicrobium sediminis TaxID=1478221 RepID=A0A267MKX0_9FIRM|nr:LacI family DNA-binding transcriptional regulator [Anaeromicrobium sediminis]PAB60067.1 hypothetical protein CCE28_06740 [Anaeromicrobium sediminis]
MNIKDVAKKAGVSVATISRVLNHPDTVSPTTKEHVLAIMKELNYTPNWFARGLNLNKTNVIALLIPNILNPIYTQIAKGVEDIAHQKGYNILLCNTEENESKEREYIEMLLKRKVDGLILTASLLNKKDINKIKKRETPLVMIGKNKSSAKENMVFTDYIVGAYEATKHLVETGYRKIAYISGVKHQIENIEKQIGYEKALKEFCLPVEKKYIIEGNNSIEGGYLAAKKLIQSKEIPEAIFAANDLMAVGAMDAIKTMGLRIPQDIAIVGFDNIDMSALVEPKLTTISQPVYKMGLIAARLLFDNIESNDEEENVQQEIFLQSKLKVRKSCGHEDRLREIFN